MAEDCDDCVAPVCSGVRTFDGDDSVSYRWALYSREAVESWLGRSVASDDPVDLAYTLTGWAHYYGGAGQFFANTPAVRMVRGRILVVQRCGSDI